MSTPEEFEAELTRALVRRGRALAAEIKTMTEEMNKIKSRLEEIVPVGWKEEIDGVSASRKPGNRTFSEQLALAQFTTDEKLSCVARPAVDPKLVRALADAKNITQSCMALPDASKTSVKLS